MEKLGKNAVILVPIHKLVNSNNSILDYKSGTKRVRLVRVFLLKKSIPTGRSISWMNFVSKLYSGVLELFFFSHILFLVFKKCPLNIVLMFNDANFKWS